MAGLSYALEEPLALRVSKQPRLRGVFEGGARGLLFGAAANVVALRFVPMVVARFTPLPWAVGALALLLLSCEQAVRWVAAALVCVQLARRGVPRWAAFAIGVYAGTFVPVVFPWNPAGGVTPWPAMVQLAELVGERGVTLLMAVSAAWLASAARAYRAGIRKQAVMLAGLAIALPLLQLVHGKMCIARVEATRARAEIVHVGLLQPGVDALARWRGEEATPILDELTRLTVSAEKRGAELTIWPEDAYPIPLPHATRRCPIGAFAILPYGVRGPVLTGLVMNGANGDLYNAAAVCYTDGALGEPYDKLNLLLFGETVPVLDRISWVRRTFNRGTGMVPGSHNVIQRAGKIRASVLNCFEDTLPDAGRVAMADHPNLLVNVTNDAWFAGSGESELHLRLAVLRAVESRRDLVRAVNLGPASWVSASGLIKGRYASELPGVLPAEPALLETEPTVFDRYGDAPLVLLLLVGTFLRLRKGGEPALLRLDPPPLELASRAVERGTAPHKTPRAPSRLRDSAPFAIESSRWLTG